MSAAGQIDPAAFRAAAIALQIDRVTAEVVGSMEGAGIEVLVLKGPGFAELFYADGSSRPYGDTDLLVAPQAEDTAQDVLRGLGFEPDLRIVSRDPFAVARHHTWQRGQAFVDLHITLEGVNGPAALVWPAFAARARPIRAGGSEVMVPGVTAQLLHAGLHAAQHGGREPKPLRDLKRALDYADDARWRQVAGLADELGAMGALIQGLRLVPDGESLVDRLSLSRAPTRKETLRATSAPAPAVGIERFLKRRGAERWRAVLRTCFPSPEYLRDWIPVARRGRAGLMVAYVLRPAWVLVALPVALVEWVRAGRRAT